MRAVRSRHWTRRHTTIGGVRAATTYFRPQATKRSDGVNRIHSRSVTRLGWRGASINTDTRVVIP
jgi:hypothetical protein